MEKVQTDAMADSLLRSGGGKAVRKWRGKKGTAEEAEEELHLCPQVMCYTSGRRPLVV
jgi:hypothetical protein